MCGWVLTREKDFAAFFIIFIYFEKATNDWYKLYGVYKTLSVNQSQQKVTQRFKGIYENRKKKTSQMS